MHRLSYLVVLVGLAALPAQAAVFTVNSSNDVDDGVCTTTHCSLREAIRAANVNPGFDDIRFNIAPGGLQTITPFSALPSLSDAVNLDATSQPGYAGSPIIQLRGGAAGAASGLQILAGSCTVKGLAIFDFALDAISVSGPGGNTIAGNFLGTDSSGVGIGNAGNGIRITDSANNRVEDNVLSSNDDNGALIQGGAATGNRLVGNKIGTTASGGGALGNTLNGVLVQAGASSSVIGDLPSGDGNIIGNNGLAGVAVTSGTKNSIRRNSIHSNAGLGIDLGVTGVTLNDGNDPDSGANMLQNYPLLRNARFGLTTLIDWRLISTPFTSFTVELFSNSTCDPSTYGEGRTYLGQSSSTTDFTGYTPVVTVALPSVPVGYYITATAIDPNGNTSEFAHCEQVK